jgi:hypothetical protein
MGRCGDTISLNPGMNPNANAKVPNYITIDTAARKARYFKDGELADVADLRSPTAGGQNP